MRQPLAATAAFLLSAVLIGQAAAAPRDSYGLINPEKGFFSTTHRNHLSVGFVDTRIKSGESVSGDGYALSGGFTLGEHIFAGGLYTASSLEQSGRNAGDADRTRLFAGARRWILDYKAETFASASYDRIEVDGGELEGFSVDLGVRGKPLQQVVGEIRASYGLSVEDSAGIELDVFALEVTAMHQLIDQVYIGLGYEWFNAEYDNGTSIDVNTGRIFAAIVFD